jgi:hypothetical protein
LSVSELFDLRFIVQALEQSCIEMLILIFVLVWLISVFEFYSAALRFSSGPEYTASGFEKNGLAQPFFAMQNSRG